MQSMTGYGRGEVQDEQLQLTIEMRSVNHRYLDLSLRYPRMYAPLESRMKQLMGDYFTRGRIEVTIAHQALGASDRAVVVDQELAQQYHRALNQLQETLRLPGTVDLGLLLTLREILKVEEVETDAEVIWELMHQGIVQASEALQQMRMQEGAFLADDLDADRQGLAVIQYQPTAHLRQVPIGDHTLHFHHVHAQDVVARMQQPVGQLAIVRQQQHTLGIHIQTPDRKQP